VDAANGPESSCSQRVSLCCSLLSCGGDGLIAVYDVANELNKRGYRAKALHTRKKSVELQR
jgi:hypothetical protein